MSTPRAMLTLTVSPENTGSEELRISIPMEVIEGSSTKEEETTQPEPSSKSLLISGMCRSITLQTEGRLRSISDKEIIEAAGTVMDQPGWQGGLAAAIVHVTKNECARILMEEAEGVMANEQE